MNKNDFRYMLRGQQLLDLKEEEFALLAPINQRNAKKDRALLLLHGFSSSPAVYRYLAPQLTHYDALVCPVLPGHADSIEAFSHSKSANWLSCVTQVCEGLINEYQKVDVLGLSLGGLLACKLSERFALNHLFLLAPALKLQMNINHTVTLTAILSSLGFKEIRCNAGNIISNQYAEIAYRRLQIAAVHEMFTFAQQYQWIPPSCPVDLFLGTFDLVVDSTAVEQLFLPLPNAKVHWLKNSAHVLPLDTDLNEIIQCVNEVSR